MPVLRVASDADVVVFAKTFAGQLQRHGSSCARAAGLKYSSAEPLGIPGGAAAGVAFYSFS
jgi:hypothetical protein